MATSTNLLVAFGRLLAVVEHALGRMSPGAINNSMTLPRKYLMGVQLQRALPVIRKYPALESILSEIMDTMEISELEHIDRVPLVEQGTIQLAYYQQARHLPPITKRPARGPAGVDWTSVDWSRGDAAIGEELGVTRQAVRNARAKHTK